MIGSGLPAPRLARAATPAPRRTTTRRQTTTRTPRRRLSDRVPTDAVGAPDALNAADRSAPLATSSASGAPEPMATGGPLLDPATSSPSERAGCVLTWTLGARSADVPPTAAAPVCGRRRTRGSPVDHRPSEPSERGSGPRVVPQRPSLSRGASRGVDLEMTPDAATGEAAGPDPGSSTGGVRSGSPVAASGTTGTSAGIGAESTAGSAAGSRRGAGSGAGPRAGAGTELAVGAGAGLGVGDGVGSGAGGAAGAGGGEAARGGSKDRGST
jgi:hypothetical protein